LQLALASMKSAAPDVRLPDFDFVQGWVGKMTITRTRTFLIEDLLEGGIWTKWYDNRTFRPLPAPFDITCRNQEDQDHWIDAAEFLGSVQHVQYLVSTQMCVCADWQGMIFFEKGTYRVLLTDPQIITSKTTGSSDQLFGSGNVTKNFELFPSSHQCNKYCKMFMINPLGKMAVKITP